MRRLINAAFFLITFTILITTTQALAQLLPPNLLYPEDGVKLEGRADLFWTGVDGASYYKVEISTSPEFAAANTVVFDVYLTTVGLRSSGRPQTLYWRVTAVNEQEIAVSSTWSFYLTPVKRALSFSGENMVPEIWMVK